MNTPSNELMVKEPLPDQAHEIASVLKTSIAELCGPTYRNNASILTSWCANKTPEVVCGWIEDASLKMYIAQDSNNEPSRNPESTIK